LLALIAHQVERTVINDTIISNTKVNYPVLTYEFENGLADSEHLPEQKNSEIIQDFQSTIDFFFIKSDEQFDESILESEITAMLPSNKNIAVTSMVVDKETLLGMLSEEENEAGLAAYTMLHEGIIIYGYESFYEIILEAFNKKLSVLG
ncbi:MAG: hypothetical protein II567_07030, partial [Candidatus Riflebacteria bacterium]|nr:hypothetical protein [Candidatus Riflebacteria bacterium]